MTASPTCDSPRASRRTDDQQATEATGAEVPTLEQALPVRTSCDTAGASVARSWIPPAMRKSRSSLSLLSTWGHAHGDRSRWRNPPEQQRRNWDDGALRA
jgi:hypothetical protein